MRMKSGTTFRTLISGKLILVKQHGSSKVKFYIPKAGIIKGFLGFKNIRFTIRPKVNWYSHYLIRLPFIYFEKNNCEYKLGFPNLYLWRLF